MGSDSWQVAAVSVSKESRKLNNAQVRQTQASIQVFGDFADRLTVFLA